MFALRLKLRTRSSKALKKCFFLEQQGSRCKSLYAKLTEADHANLRGLAADLHNQDKTKYEILKPPDSSLKDDSLDEDWIDIHESTIMYGSPELADHLSGHIYMRATVYEDKCSKAVRVADQLCKFTNPQILNALEQCDQWTLNTVSESDMLQRIVKSLDKECCERNCRGEWKCPDEMLRAAYLMSMNLLKVKEPLFVEHVLKNEFRIWENHYVPFLLLCGFNNSVLAELSSILNDLDAKVDDEFDSFSSTELAVIYTGLKAISNSKTNLEALQLRIHNRFGFRLT